MSNYDTSKYDPLVPLKDLKKFLRFILFLPIILLATWGAREINTYKTKMEELIELKDSYIEELLNPKLSESKLEAMKGRIAYLETSEHFDRSPSKGIWMLVGSFVLASIWVQFENRKKKENKSAHTTSAIAPR